MNILEVKPNVFVFDNEEYGSNSGWIKTEEGVVLIDTCNDPAEIESALAEGGVAVEDVKLVINTHADGDHVAGNFMFDCPKMAHELTFERMSTGRMKKANLPTQTFTEDTTINFGGFEIFLQHKGGHKPDEIIVWLPKEKVLFTGDLVFQGRYPYMVSSYVPDWITALEDLKNFGADVIVPGHGTLVEHSDIDSQIAYMKDTWNHTEKLQKAGMSRAEILVDQGFPKPDGWGREQLYPRNIEIILDQIMSR